VIFANRRAAGQELARELLARFPQMATENPLVLAIPRGGVPVGYEIATAIGARLDVFVARKLGAPGQEELGIGAVAPGGTRVLDHATITMLGVTDEYIERVTRDELQELERRMRRFRGDRPPPCVVGHAVVLVDDGLATGVTARASVAALRGVGAARLIFAAPVCSPEGSALVASEGAAVVCVASPARFYGVGAWYEDFTQTTDEEVEELLARAGTREE